MVDCPACDTPNSEGARFCNACGAALRLVATTRREERKVISVVFCDLVGFTSRAERLDPEDVRALLRPYHEHLRSEFERLGGTVEKFIGDAVVALFGAPVAHEDDAERAVRAALAIRDWALEQGDDLQVRIAVNTGEALVALDASSSEGETMASGDVMNTTARLQAAAPVNGILVGEQTWRATSDVIDYRAAESVIAKGKAQPILAWEALDARSRFGVDLAARSSLGFVGRSRELELLRATLDRVAATRSPQLVTIIGVPGIGKSRLIGRLFEDIDGDPDLVVRWRQGRCLSYGTAVFWALGEIVKAHAGILETDTPAIGDEKLQAAVGSVMTDDADAEWLAGFLRPLVGGAADANLPADRLELAYAAWRRFLEGVAESVPLVVVVEDLHWAEPPLLDFIDQLVDWATDVPLLVLCTARPELLERRPGWGGGKSNASTVSLSPLTDDETAQLVSNVLDRPLLDAQLQATILGRAGGNPLYAEQFSRVLLEGGPLDTLPASLQGIIAARLDALSGDEKSTLQDAAVVGKVFWLGALEALGGVPRWRLEAQLHSLERKGFVRRARRSSVGSEGEYAFDHLLLRDVAYSQIPRAPRAEKHRRAASWIESLGRPDDHAEMLAYHYLTALELVRATGAEDVALVEHSRMALRSAGERSLSLGAYTAAASLLGDALALWPDDPERADVLLAEGVARFFVDDTGTDLTEEALERFEADGREERAAEAAVELARMHFFHGERDRADRSLDRALALTKSSPLSAARAHALVARSAYHMLAGEYRDAIAVVEIAMPVVEGLGLTAARARLFDVRGISRTALGDAGGLQDGVLAVELAREAGAFFEYIVATNNLRISQISLGQVEEARQTFEAFRDRVTRFGSAMNRRWLRYDDIGLAYLDGRWDDGLALIDDELRRVASGSPYYLEPQAWRTRALIEWARDDLRGAGTDSERALDLARARKDAQVLVPALVTRAAILLAMGARDAARSLVLEVIELGEPGVTGAQEDALAMSAWCAVDVGMIEEAKAALAMVPTSTLTKPALDILEGNGSVAADALGRLQWHSVEAYTRLRTAQAARRADVEADITAPVEAALAFYRRAGATAFIREAEALLGDGTAAIVRAAS